MPERRTEVVVDFRVGNVNYTGGGDPVEIPVELDFDEGGGGSGSHGPGIDNIFGGGWRRWIERQITQFVVPLLQNAFKFLMANPEVLAAIAVGVGAIATAFASLFANFTIATTMLKGIWKAAQWSFNQVIAIVKKAGEAFVSLAFQGIQITIDTLARFTQEVIKAATALASRLGKSLKDVMMRFIDAEKNIASTAAVLGYTGAEADKIRDKLTQAGLEISATSVKTFAEISKGMDLMSRAGRDFIETTEMMPGATRLAEATLTDMDDAVRILNSTMQQFGIEAGRSVEVANALTAATLAAPVEITDLGLALSYVGSTASMMNVSLEHTLALIAGLAKQGRTGGKAGMELSNIFNVLSKRTDKAAEVLGRYGIQLDQMSVAQRGLGPVLQEFVKLGTQLQQQFGADKGIARLAEVLQEAFNIRAARGLAGLLMETTESIDSIREAVTGTNKALDVSVEMLRSTYGRWWMLESLWETVEFTIAKQLNPSLMWLLEVFHKLITQAQEAGIFEKFGKTFRDLAIIIGKLAWKIVPALVEAADRMLDSFPEAIRQIGAAAEAVLPRILETIGKLPEMLKQFVNELLPSLFNVVRTLVPLLLRFGENVLPRLITAFSSFGVILADFLTANGDRIIAWFNFVLNTAIALMNYWPTLLANWESFKQTLIGLWEAAKPFIYDFLAYILTIMPVVGEIVTKVMNLFITMAFGAGQQFTGLGDAIKAALEWINENFEPIVGWAARVLQNFFNIVSLVARIFNELLAFLVTMPGPVQAFITGLGLVLGFFNSIVYIVNKATELFIRLAAIIARLFGANEWADSLDDIADGFGAVADNALQVLETLLLLPNAIARAGDFFSRMAKKAADAFGAVRDQASGAGFGPDAAAAADAAAREMEAEERAARWRGDTAAARRYGDAAAAAAASPEAKFRSIDINVEQMLDYIEQATNKQIADEFRRRTAEARVRGAGAAAAGML